MNMRSSCIMASMLSAAALLGACGGGGGNGGGSGTPPPTPLSLGLMKITVSGLGTNSMTSHAELLSVPGSGQQPHVINTEPSGIDVKQVSSSSIDVGTRGAGGERYFNVVYGVRNAQFCATPGSCTAYALPNQNITFIGAATSSNIDSTAVTQLNRFDGTVDTASIAQEILPTHGALLNGAGTGVLVQPGYESMQVYSEAEIAAIPLDSGATGLFPYGYVVKNVNTAGSRTLPASPAVNQFDGQLAFSFKVPLQPVQTDDPYSIVFIFQVVEDTNTRVTQSAEEQDALGDLTATARAAALGGTDLAVLGGRAAETNIADPICTVRTAGTAAAPLAYLVNHGNNPTLAGSPYNLESRPAAGAINSGFCTAMNAGSFTSLVVSGSQSGPRTAAGAYSGTYGGGGSNQLSFTPDAAHPFFPGETVSFSHTTGLTSTGSVALTAPFVGSYRVASGTASGTFGAHSEITVGNGLPKIEPASVAAGDFSGDGRLDLAVADFLDAGVAILHNNGGGVFAAPGFVGPVGGGPFAVVAADFNGDGNLDLAVAYLSSNKIDVLLGNGSDNFGAPVSHVVGNSPEALAVGDFNGDGRPDLAVTNTGDGTVSILLNSGLGNGTFSTAATLTGLTAGTIPLAVAVGDFNGDGKLDLAVANTGGGNVAVFLGNGDGSFGTATTYSTGAGSGPHAIAVGDINNDGASDLVVADYLNGAAVLLLGNGAGAFAAPVAYAVGAGSRPFAVVIGDFNGDGKPDVATANQGDGTVSVLINTGSGYATGSGFAAAVDYAVGSTAVPSPNSIIAGDVNGDGRLDLVVANFNETDISILLGQP